MSTNMDDDGGNKPASWITEWNDVRTLLTCDELYNEPWMPNFLDRDFMRGIVSECMKKRREDNNMDFLIVDSLSQADIIDDNDEVGF